MADKRAETKHKVQTQQRKLFLSIYLRVSLAVSASLFLLFSNPYPVFLFSPPFFFIYCVLVAHRSNIIHCVSRSHANLSGVRGGVSFSGYGNIEFSLSRLEIESPTVISFGAIYIDFAGVETVLSLALSLSLSLCIDRPSSSEQLYNEISRLDQRPRCSLLS